MVDINELLTHIDLRVLAEAAGAKFNGRGKSSACPLHRGTNPTAFHIYRGEQGVDRWHCFTGCQTGGNAIDFYMRWRDVDFRTAVAELEAWVGNVRQLPAVTAAPAAVSAPSPEQPPGQKWQNRCITFLKFCQDELWNCEPAITYLTKHRGLTHKTIGQWGLGWNPNDAWDDAAEYGLDSSRIWWPQGIVIPGWRNDALWYVKIRRPLGIDFDACGLGVNGQVPNQKAKYMSVRGGVKALFGESHLANRKVLALTEGEFDSMLLHQIAGDLVDVLTLGGAAGHFAAEDLMILAGYRKIIACHDNDSAGSQARQRLLSSSIRVVDCPPRGHDITDMWHTHGAKAVRQWVADAVYPPSQPEPAPGMRMVVERLDLNGDAGWQAVR